MAEQDVPWAMVAQVVAEWVRGLDRLIEMRRGDPAFDHQLPLPPKVSAQLQLFDDWATMLQQLAMAADRKANETSPKEE